jgi:hypothetical protein
MNPMDEIPTNNLEAGVALFQALNLSISDRADPIKMDQVKEIGEYLNSHPEPTWLIRTLVDKNKVPNRSNLEHILSYVRMDKERMAKQAEIDALTNGLRYYL